MYFGLYLIASRHREFYAQSETLPPEAVHRAPSILAFMFSWLGRVFH